MKSVVDIFKLKKEDIEGLEGFGEKSAENLINAIEKSKDIPLHKFIFSLGVRQVGEVAAKDLAKKFGSFENLVSEIDKLIENKKGKTILELKEEFAVAGLGEKSLESILEYFENKKNRKFLEEMQKIVRIKEEKKELKKENSNFKNKTFVITGTLSKPREEFQNIIESLGGKISSSVSKKTDYVLLGENEDSKISTKEKTARDLGVKIMNESTFEKLLK